MNAAILQRKMDYSPASKMKENRAEIKLSPGSSINRVVAIRNRCANIYYNENNQDQSNETSFNKAGNVCLPPAIFKMKIFLINFDDYITLFYGE